MLLFFSTGIPSCGQFLVGFVEHSLLFRQSVVALLSPPDRIALPLPRALFALLLLSIAPLDRRLLIAAISHLMSTPTMSSNPSGASHPLLLPSVENLYAAVSPSQLLSVVPTPPAVA